MTQSSIRPRVSLGLPGRYYSDSEILNRELKTIWRSTWQMVGRIETIPSPGDYLSCMLGIEPIVVIRLEDGSLEAMHNVCPHRGARLLTGQGNCQHKIVCPYHAWTFAPTGELLGITQPKLFPNLDKSQIRLLKARVETWGGFIFVNPDPEGESLSHYLADFPQYLEQYDRNWEDLREVTRLEYDEPVNWKFIVENYIETYHFPVAHRETLTPMYDLANTPTIPTGRHLFYPFPYHQDDPGETFEHEWEQDKVSYQGYIFPNLMVNTTKAHVSVFRLTPLSPDRTYLEVIIYQTPEQSSTQPFDRQGYDTVMEEDMAVCRYLQAGVNSRAYQVTQLAQGQEDGIEYFHNVLSQYL
jgi:phenylpropionate dioxygenase-like ring-hydroxylating dioxygenase large terminal subunit